MSISRSARLLILAILLAVSAGPVAAGTCSGGPYNGSFCNYHYECKKWCNSGPYSHKLCLYDFECGKVCVAGVNAGRLCNSNLDCPGSGCQQIPCIPFYCAGGSPPSAGEPDGLQACSDPLADLFASLAVSR